MKNRFTSLHRALLAAALVTTANFSAQAQSVGIGTTTPDASAALDITSSTKGLLVPRVASASAVASPAPGLLVYQTGSPAGFYYNAGTAAAPSWQQLGAAASGSFVQNTTTQQAGSNFNISGDGTVAGTLTAVNAVLGTATVTGALTGSGASIGTAVGVGIRTDGGLNLGQNGTGNNILLGYQAGQALTTGSNNLHSGYQAGNGTTTGSNNLFSGYQAGQNNTTGSNNTALGYNSGPASGSGALTNATAVGANVSLTTSNTLILGNGGSVGIGTSAPTAKLTVQLASDTDQGLLVTDGTTTGNIVIQPLTGGNTGFSVINYNGYYSAGEARFNTAKNRWRVGTDQRSTSDLFFIDTYNGTSGSAPLAITSGGNVGIGTTTPQQRLDVSGTLSTATVGTQPLLRLTRPGKYNVKYANSLELALGSYGTNSSSQSQVNFNLANGNTDNPDATVMSLQASGNVGIGTTNPTQKLEVAGQVFSNSGGFRFPDNTVQTTATTVTATNGLSQTGSTIGLGGSLTRATTITQANNAFSLTGGNVGIGTTTPSSSETLDVNGSLRVGTSTTPGAVHTPTTATHNMLAVAYGQIGTNGTTFYSTSGNYTVAHSGTGIYKITFPASSGLSGVNFDNYPVIVTIYGNVGVGSFTGGTGYITLTTYLIDGSPTDLIFNFVAYAP